MHRVSIGGMARRLRTSIVQPNSRCSPDSDLRVQGQPRDGEGRTAGERNIQASAATNIVSVSLIFLS